LRRRAPRFRASSSPQVVGWRTAARLNGAGRLEDADHSPEETQAAPNPRERLQGQAPLHSLSQAFTILAPEQTREGARVGEIDAAKTCWPDAGKRSDRRGAFAKPGAYANQPPAPSRLQDSARPTGCTLSVSPVCSKHLTLLCALRPWKLKARELTSSDKLLISWTL
jgi:hypothetical protein